MSKERGAVIEAMARGMRGNLPNLVANTLDGFEEGAQHLYLALLDRYQGWSDREGELRAFRGACHYSDGAGGIFEHILDRGPGVPPDGPWKGELKKFMADRWLHNFASPITTKGTNE